MPLSCKGDRVDCSGEPTSAREERGIRPSVQRLLLAGGIGAAAAMIGSRMGDFSPVCRQRHLLVVASF
jgi:hypothetical protein